MFYFIENCHLYNYADDNALHTFDCHMSVIKEKLHSDFEILDI